MSDRLTRVPSLAVGWDGSAASFGGSEETICLSDVGTGVPAAITDGGAIYADEVDGEVELFYRGNGPAYQLTDQGPLAMNSAIMFIGTIINWEGAALRYTNFAGPAASTTTIPNLLMPFDCTVVALTVTYNQTVAVTASTDDEVEFDMVKFALTDLPIAANAVSVAGSTITVSGSAGPNDVNGTFFSESVTGLSESITAGERIGVRKNRTGTTFAPTNADITTTLYVTVP